MIHILAVMSQYEIELFTARGIDGKISSAKNRGAYNGGPCPYGYTISSGTGKLIVNPKEAEIVRTILPLRISMDLRRRLIQLSE